MILIVNTSFILTIPMTKSQSFRFKQFEVWHDLCAMKVGTDGVLLGAWCPFTSHSPHRILDIGTGSGLIALMLAQRLSQDNMYMMDAIDIDPNAITQAKKNFNSSPWNEHLHAHQCALQDWHPNSDLYDLIVSNPPFFVNSLKTPDAARTMARHTDSISFEELIYHSSQLLADKGIFALILPYEHKQTILSLAQTHHLYLHSMTDVHTRDGVAAKRILLAFEKNVSPSIIRKDRLVLSYDGNTRSPEYANLCKEFYL